MTRIGHYCRKALKWLCTAFVVFVLLIWLVGNVVEHGWIPVLGAVLFMAALYGALAL
jgi:hypothetical protein